MFTGIIEEVGKISQLKKNGRNLEISIEAKMADQLKVDQSVAHNGVCLTVVSRSESSYRVVAVDETLQKSNLGGLKVGDAVNLERGMKLGARLDGHIVQGHVDQTGVCTGISEADGSHVFSFSYPTDLNNYTIEKGSITVNGVSLTVVNSTPDGFSVAIIPYTYQHTTFKSLQVGDKVNLEFDVIGKYVQRLLELRR